MFGLPGFAKVTKGPKKFARPGSQFRAPNRSSARTPVGCALLMLSIACCPSLAQTVQVDITPGHVVNRFSPMYALGSTVDRVPSNATDVFFRPDQIADQL